MNSFFVQENKVYSIDDLAYLFKCNKMELSNIINELKNYKILNEISFNDEEFINYSSGSNFELSNNYKSYQFKFVGVIVLKQYLIKCLPKYLDSASSIKDTTISFKKILKVIQKIKLKKELFYINDFFGDFSTLNRLSLMMFLLDDFHENGVYSNVVNQLEINGQGDINWERTISNQYPIIDQNRPYYFEIHTQKKINDDNDYFKRLHEFVLTESSHELKRMGLLELLDITGVDVSNDDIESLGGMNYARYQIEKEQNIQFITRKKIILKLIEYFFSEHNIVDYNVNYYFYGTFNFELVWEEVCSSVLNNHLSTSLEFLPIELKEGYNPKDSISSLIEKPIWYGYLESDILFQREARGRLKPDIVSLIKNNKTLEFRIYDAKYYVLHFNEEEPLKNYPGISDITKQYLYQLAFKNFLIDHKITSIKNYFLFPSTLNTITNKGFVELKMLSSLELVNVEVIMLPADGVYELYLSNKKINSDFMNYRVNQRI